MTITPPIPPNEAERQAALLAYDILDSLPETAYDDLVFMATEICRTPIAAMTFIDGERQWLKSEIGVGTRETRRDTSFCAYTILDPGALLVVPDANEDLRFADNPYVRGNPHIAFYAGAPLVSREGQAIGSICVIDKVARQLEESQKRALMALSRQIMAQLELRRNLQELHEAKGQLEKSQGMFNAFMDNNPSDAFIKGADGRMLYANATLLKRLGVGFNELHGKKDEELWPAVATELVEHDREVLAAQKALSFEEHLTGPDGRDLTWLTVKFPLTGTSGEQLIGGVGIDITERKFYEQQLEQYQNRLEEVVDQLAKLSTTDALSGLNNKRAFDQQLEESFERSRRMGTPLSVILLDVDHFKKFNDTEGHAAGDAVIREVGQLLMKTVRPGDFAARYGGEEFVIILDRTASDGAFMIAERVRRAFKNWSWPGKKVTASLGAADLRAEMQSGSELVKAADDALYKSKADGRDRVSLAA